jgi:hypothetical protein
MPMEPMLDNYNENSTLQATSQDFGNPILSTLAEEYGSAASKEDLQSVRIAEYGCSGGRNSYLPMHTIISALRRNHPALRAEFILEDLPSNPWHRVMEEKPRLTAAFPGAVHVLCAGTSFYEQVCSDQSVDIAYSYVAAHFLSHAPKLSTHVLMHETNNGEKGPWEAQAARDWENFLLLRARELKRGGKMMISTMSRDDSGYSWKEFSHIVWDSIRKVRARGVLLEKEIEVLCIPTCLRSESELLAPFARTSQVSSLLEVNSLQFYRTEVPGERAMPLDALALLIRKRIEAVWGGMFVTQLEGLGRTHSSARDAMKEVWDEFQNEIAKDPSRGWLDMRFYCLEVTRKRQQSRSRNLTKENDEQIMQETVADLTE